MSRKHRVPGRKSPKRNILRDMVIKLTKIKAKEKIIKLTRESNITYKGISIMISADFFQQKFYRPEGIGNIYLK